MCVLNKYSNKDDTHVNQKNVLKMIVSQNVLFPKRSDGGQKDGGSIQVPHIYSLFKIDDTGI